MIENKKKRGKRSDKELKDDCVCTHMHTTDGGECLVSFLRH